jgi:hypothetical protein
MSVANKYFISDAIAYTLYEACTLTETLEENKGLLPSEGRRAMTSRLKTYEKMIASQLKDYEAGIASRRQEIEESAAADTAPRRAALAELEVKAASVKDALARLREAGPDATDRAKASVEIAWSDFKHAYDDMLT